MVGEKLSPVLEEIENALWDFEANFPNVPPGYTDDAFRSIVKIFMSALMDKMWLSNNGTEMNLKQEARKAQNAGQEIRELIKKYTGIDSFDLYK